MTALALPPQIAPVSVLAIAPAQLEAGLRQAFADEAVWAAFSQGRQGLVAPAAVLVAPDQLAALTSAVATLDAALRQRAADAPDPGVLGFDFHLTETGPRLIEVNTNPGGLLLALAQARLCLTAWPELSLAGLDPEAAALRAAQAFAGKGRHLLLVDDEPERQFLYPEFLLYRHLFHRLGLRAAIADARALDPARLADCDAVYNRLTDFPLADPAHAALAAAWRHGLALTPDPRCHAAYADKRQMAALCGRAELAGLIPPTRLGVEDWSSTWAERRYLFFKPALGHGGKGAYRGGKISRATWDGLDPAAYVVQQVVPPPVAENGLKVDIRAFAVHGTVLAFAARLYQGQTTNFRTPGGGLAAVFADPRR